MNISGGKLKQKSFGFTIVELLVVIVVIGILAAITIVSYTGISQKAAVASLQSDLTNAANQLKIDQVLNGKFPDAMGDANGGKGIPFSSVQNPTYSVDNSVSPQTFCIAATKSGVTYKITNDSTPSLGACPTMVATGGTITDITGYRVHTFTSSGTFAVTGTGGNVEVLVVAGGGGGGSTSNGGAGGGGGGGLVYNAAYTLTNNQSVSITVGNGGNGGVFNANQPGVNGGNSVFGTITSVGGGGGGQPGVAGIAGGSGGGAGFNGYSIVYSGGVATSGQGYAGGATTNFSSAGGGGGGGAGGIGGANKAAHAGGDAGLGLSYSISGSPVTYAAGGIGGTMTATPAAASPANTGKGGDGAYAAQTAYAGGSGVVIVRYIH